MGIKTNQPPRMTTRSIECPYCGAFLKSREAEVSGYRLFAGYEECCCSGAEMARKASKEEERRKAKLAAVEKHKKRIAMSGIPVRFQSSVGDVSEWLPAIRGNRSLLFTGPQGVGKTHLACSIGVALIDEMSVRFTSIMRIKASILGQEMTEAELYRRLSKCDLLILDDLGKEKPGEWVIGLIYSVVNTRYEDMRPMIITSNMNMEKLEAFMTVGKDNMAAKAIVSRIYEMCGGAPVHMHGEDRRLGRSH